MNNKYDMIIVGGSFVGLSLALSVKDKLKVAIIEAKPRLKLSDSDPRAIVLSLASKRFLEALGVWEKLHSQAVPVKKVHVSEKGRFGAVRIDAKQERVDALGYVVNAGKLYQTLYELVKGSPNVGLFHDSRVVELVCDHKQSEMTVEFEQTKQKFLAELIVAADGTNSTICKLAGLNAKSWGEGYQSLVTSVEVDSLNGVAYERFIKNGAVAMIPKTGGYKNIFTLPDEEIEKLKQYSDAEFLQHIQKTFGYRLGKITRIGERQAFPLKIIHRKEIVKPGLIVVGNAAHTIYPIAAQGLNLGLRDVAKLSELIKKDETNLLKEYENARCKDHQRMVQFTDKVLKFKLSRRAGMLGLELFPFAKHALAKRTMGFV